MGCCSAFWQTVWQLLGWGKKKPEPAPTVFVLPAFREEPTDDDLRTSPALYNEVFDDGDAGYLEVEDDIKDPRGLVEYSLTPDSLPSLEDIPPFDSPIVLPPAPVEIIHNDELDGPREWIDVGGWWKDDCATPPPVPSTEIPSPLET